MAEPASSMPSVLPRLVVVWRVTTRCMLRCGFCAYDRRLPFARVDSDELSARRLGRLLSRHGASTGRAVHVSLLGGEPFGWSPLADVAHDFKRLGLSLGVTTNGTSLGNERARELLLECFDELTVSIDGLAAVHDELRGWPGGFAQLERALTTLSEAKRRRGLGPVLRVNCVLMRDNVRDLGELCESLAAWGVEELTFNRLGGRDRPEFFARHRLLAEDLAWLSCELPRLQRELGPRGLTIRGSAAYVRRLQQLEAGVAVRVEDCRPGEQFLFVDELGRAAPCHFTLDEYGQEPTAGADLNQLLELFRDRQQCRRAAACDDCQSTQVFEKFRGVDGP